MLIHYYFGMGKKYCNFQLQIFYYRYREHKAVTNFITQQSIYL